MLKASSDPGSPEPVLATGEGRPLRLKGARSAAAGGRPGLVAALDLGTNNCRLLVAKPTGAGFRVVDAFSRIVRLGEGLSLTGALSEAAMGRTLEALKVCAAKIRHRGVSRARAVATEACRRADNCGEFLDRVRSETGLDIEIITTDEEARLAVTGCAPLLDRRIPHALVFDIGGGSTELVFVHQQRQAWEILGSMSLACGVVTLTERYGGDTLAIGTYDAMVAEVRAALSGFEKEHGIRRRIAEGGLQMLGSSGTVTTLAGVHFDLPRYNRAVIDGTELGFGAISGISRRLAGSSYAERARHPCIGRERADLVVSGCAILDAICAEWPVGRLRVADRGVREGILFGLIGTRH